MSCLPLIFQHHPYLFHKILKKLSIHHQNMPPTWHLLPNHDFELVFCLRWLIEWFALMNSNASDDGEHSFATLSSAESHNEILPVF